MTTRTRTPEGVILADAAYTVRELRLRLGIGAWAWRTLRQRGLKIRKIGKQRLVLGEDVIMFIKSLNIEDAPRNPLGPTSPTRSGGGCGVVWECAPGEGGADETF